MRLKEKLLFFNYFFWTVTLPLGVVGMAVGGGVKRLVCVTTTPLAEVTIFMDVEGAGTLLEEDEEMVLITLDKEVDEVIAEDGKGPDGVGVTLGDSTLGDTVTFIIKFNAVNEQNERWFEKKDSKKIYRISVLPLLSGADGRFYFSECNSTGITSVINLLVISLRKFINCDVNLSRFFGVILNSTSFIIPSTNYRKTFKKDLQKVTHLRWLHFLAFPTVVL